jgi:site-specific DNA-cytosine methylase
MVDIIIGAPDCGHSSVLSFSRAKKLGNPAENDSLNVFIFSILHYQPKIFMMENLPKMLENWGTGINQIFQDYELLIFTHPVSAWGNSQASRLRLVVVGIKKGSGIDSKVFKLPKETLLKTSGELRKGLQLGVNGHVRESDDTMLSLYYGDQRSITAGEAKKIWVTEFKDLKKWAVNKGNLINQPGIYRNFDKDLPLTVRKQNRQFNEDGEILSPREVARIQGVPDKFKLWISEDRFTYSLNKARITLAKSPPYEIGKWFYNCIEKL